MLNQAEREPLARQARGRNETPRLSRPTWYRSRVAAAAERAAAAIECAASGSCRPPSETDPETQARLAAFRQGLEQLGWKEGRNIRFEYRWSVGDAELIKKHAAELVALAPDLILVGSHPGRAGAQARDAHDPDRIRERRRPGRQRPRSEPREAGRQRHRVHRRGVRHRREMAGTAQGDRARHRAGRAPRQPGGRLREELPALARSASRRRSE